MTERDRGHAGRTANGPETQLAKRPAWLPTIRLKMWRTKIIATLGPATTGPQQVAALVAAGVNGVRINFSHGTHDEHAAAIAAAREASDRLGRPVAILGDLCGPKIRVGRFEQGAVDLITGETVVVTTRPGIVGTATMIPALYESLAQDVDIGQRLLLDDGRLELEVTAIIDDKDITARVVRGGRLSDHKGINLPGCALSVPSLTSKDLDDLAFCLDAGVDYVALSFVRQAADITVLRERIAAEVSTPTTRPGIIAKIEKPEALDNIEEIMMAADAIMIARGDLGVEVPAERVPLIQSHLIQCAIRCHKPVIVATQMLESMITSAQPTRAEVTDVAGAVLQRADALMLSAETAVGRYPQAAVEVMDRVVREVEGYMWRQGMFGRLKSDISIYAVPNALARACTLLSQDLEIRAVNVLTRTGHTARIISSARPQAPIIAYTDDAATRRRMVLYWGVYPVPGEGSSGPQEAFAETAAATVKAMGLAAPGENILLVSSPLKKGGTRPLSSIIIYEVT